MQSFALAASFLFLALALLKAHIRQNQFECQTLEAFKKVQDKLNSNVKEQSK